MSEWIEVSASTVDAAKEQALDLLGIPADDAEFEVMADAGKQLFGLRRTDARVRARVRPSLPRPKDGSRRQRREQSSGRDRARRGRRDQSGNGSRTQGDAKGDSARAGRRRRNGDERDDSGRPGVDSKAGEGQGSGSRRGVAGSDGAGTKSGAKSRKKRSTTGDGPRRNQEDAVSTEEMSMTDQAAEVGSFLEGLLEAFDLDGQVVVGEVEDDTVIVDVQGQDLGLLIGPRGQTMTAVHELTKTVLQRSSGSGPRLRVRLDVAGYRQRRREALANFVRAQAAEVTASGTARALEPMNAADRKVVHDTVNELTGVATVSDGDEPRRRVIIVPAD